MTMTDEERIEMIRRAMDLLDSAGILLVEATRHHYMASYKANPDDLLDKNGKPIEIDMDGIGNKPICVELMNVGRCARRDAAKIKDTVHRYDHTDGIRTIKFDNLIDVNTGKTVEIEVPDDFDENDPQFLAAGERGAEFGARVRAVAEFNDEQARNDKETSDTN